MILMYHKVHPTTPTIWWVSVNSFYKQMIELTSKEVVYLNDYNPDSENQVVITFDGVYQNVLTYAAPIMNAFGYPFELFVTSDTIGKGNEFDSVEPYCPFANYDELKELIQLGGRIQWHTRSHPDMKDMADKSLILAELSIPKDVIELDPLGNKWFAYPYGNFNDTVKEIVREKFLGAISCNQGSDHDPYAYNRITMLNETSLSRHSVAVIIASYNYGSFLAEAIESVLRQTYLPSEILITDDCSQDNTQEISLEYVKKFPTLIRYNKNEENLGVVKNFNKAVSLTKAEYICFLGADNRFMSNYLEKCIKILNKNDNLAIAYTDYAFFGSRAELTYNQLIAERKGEIKDGFFYLVNFPEFTKEAIEELKTSNFIHGSSMYRRTAFDDVGGYHDNMGIPEDFNLFSRMIKNGWRAEKARNTLLEYRQHSRDQVNNKSISYRELEFYKKKCKEYELEINKIKSRRLWKLIILLDRIRNVKNRITAHYKKEGLVRTAYKIYTKLIKYKSNTQFKP